MIRIQSKTIRSIFLALAASVVICCGTPQAIPQVQKQKTGEITAGDTPQLIAPGIVSTTMGEYSPTLDVKRKELYFMRRTPELFDYTIYVSRFDGANWSKPEIAPFSGKFRDAAPYLNPAADEIFFDSARPVEGLAKNSINLWRAVREGDSWGEANLLRVPSENLPQEDRAGEDEFGPAVDGVGNLYFYSFRAPKRGGARYLSKDKLYEKVELSDLIPDPSASTFVSYLYISPDGNTAVMDGRAEGRKDNDIFYSCRGEDGKWSATKPIPFVNSNDGDGGAWITPDGGMLLFSSTRLTPNKKSGSANIYIVSTSGLPVPCRR